jgi:hypothetical protein
VGYADLSTLHSPIGGARPPAVYGRQIEANFDFLASPPRCHVYHSAVQSIATSGTAQALLFDSERSDTDTMHNVLTNTDRLVATTAGTYSPKASVAFAANGTGYRDVYFELFSAAGVSQGIVGRDSRPATAADPTHVTVDCPDVVMTAGQYLKVMAKQTCGGALDVLASSATDQYKCEASLRWVGLAA